MNLQKNELLGFLWLAGSVLLRPSYAAGIEFTANGTAIVQSYRPNVSEPAITAKYSYQVCVKNCRWYMHVICLSTEREGALKPSVPNVNNLNLVESYDLKAGTDGTNIYCIASAVQGGAKAREPFEAQERVTILEKGDVPHLEQYSILSVLWYAFASDCYLDSVNGDQLDIPFIPTSRNRYDFDYKYTASYTRYPDMPQLPVEVYFQSPGEIKYWLSESDALSKPPLHRKRPPPFDKGYTVSSYRASNFRRVGNVWIPGMADYKVFAQLLLQGDKPLPNGENLFMAQHFKFRLEGAETSSIESHFPPSPPNDAFRVIDLRFVAETPPIVGLLYDSTNAWPTLDEARQLPQFKILDEVRNSLQTLPTKARLRKSSRRWVIAVVFLVSTASIILLSRLSTKK